MDPLNERKADTPLYLSAARRFSDTFGERVVNKMAAPGSGLQSSLKACPVPCAKSNGRNRVEPLMPRQRMDRLR
jgi:hypothetical protein